MTLTRTIEAMYNFLHRVAIILLIHSAFAGNCRADWWPEAGPTESAAAFEMDAASSPSSYEATGWGNFSGASEAVVQNQLWSNQPQQATNTVPVVPAAQRYPMEGPVAASPMGYSATSGYVDQPHLTNWQSAGIPDGLMRLRVGLDALYFTRGPAADSPFIFDSSGRVVSHSDLEFDGEAAGRLTLGYSNDAGVGYEFRYYDFGQFSSEQTESGPDVLPVFFNAIPANPATSYDARYYSQLEDYELNTWFKRLPRLRLGVGLRNIQLNEQFDVIWSNLVPESGFFSMTQNDLWGGQLMAEWLRPMSSYSSLEARVAGGVYNNRVSVDAITEGFELHENKNVFSTSVNFRAGIRVQTSDHLSFRIGYEGLFLGGVALAPDQSRDLSVFSPTNDVYTDDLYVGGLYAGSTIAF